MVDEMCLKLFEFHKIFCQQSEHVKNKHVNSHWHKIFFVKTGVARRKKIVVSFSFTFLMILQQTW